MDKFANKKRKLEGSAEAQDDSISTEKPPASNNPTVPLTQKVNRKFHAEWENLYFVIEQKGKPMCLICQFEFIENRKFTVKRHFDNCHSEFDVKFPLSSDNRATEILRLKNRLRSEQKVVKQFLSVNAKHGKSYSDDEFHRQSTVETLCENCNGKLKRPLIDKIKMLPLSHQTINRDGAGLGRNGKLVDFNFIPYNINDHSIYDPNELCDRLRLLLSSRWADNTSHMQEINSIIEELRELGYIV